VIEAADKVLPPSGADRAIAVPSEGVYFVAVADGAGGTGGGASAADRLIVALTKLTAQAASADWWSVLLELDEELAGRGGETTAVVAFVDSDRVRGASVGDSAAWLISPAGEMTDLTVHQHRKPLIGSGEALPVEFEAELRGGRLLLATDGLTKYVTAERICALTTKGSVVKAADSLTACVRLPSGGPQDDVAVVIVGLAFEKGL